MAPKESAKTELDDKHVQLIGKLVCDIRNGKLKDNLAVAQATVSLLEQIINECQNPTAYVLVGMVRGVGRQLATSAPRALVATNMVRRVLRAVRDEQRNLSTAGAGAGAGAGGEGAGDSLQRLVAGGGGRRGTVSHAHHHELREQLRDHIAELRFELEGSRAAVCSAGARLLRGELVLAAPAPGQLTETFLRQAHALHPLRTLIAEGPDRRQTQAMAARLSAAGVDVTLVSNAAVFAVMCRVNKVVIGVESALIGGAVLAPAGTLALTQAAKYYNVPVLALSPLYQLTPCHTDPSHIPLHDPTTKHDYQDHVTSSTHVYAPLYDFIQPDHIALFITNLGGSSPSYVYRLLSELYDPLDSVF